ncbi:hypothetical protein NHX12_023337 [Muraenolepis orangiensis]|uniref:UBA domain-containing protein n=1 Tax=Muraenolepis orangiensis TaxID=630683 RepID=A0A9Q0EQS0_9TELE|nr:hypothetical protein NHX12_023337 [Muraenolepis orangiensis]
MMTSVGGNRARGNWEQNQGQTQHKQRPQATAEQIRLAQMISDHNDADFEEKVKQLIDITGKDQDESMIALHDCNGDVNRAINVLLEGSPDTDSWEMVGKKKSLSGQKEPSQADTGDDGKENRDRGGGERDVARRRAGAPRRGRGASRGREFRGQENGLDGSKVAGIAGRGTERGRRGRGRGRGAVDVPLLSGPGLPGRRGGRFSAQGMGQIDKEARYDFAGDKRTFNPADYTEPAQTEDGYGAGNTWNSTGDAQQDDGGARPELTPGEASSYQPKFDSAPGPWRTATEEWGTEDWNEDLSETKIFTASSAAAAPLPQENVTITKGQRIDLAVLLGKTPPSASSEGASLEAGQPSSSISQSLVFSNSKQGVPRSQAAPSAPYSQHSMVNMLSKGFGEVGGPKAGSTGTTTGSQFLEQYKTAQALAQLAAQHSQTAPSNASPSSWDTSASPLGQYDAKPDPAAHSPFTKRQPYQATNVTSSMLDAFLHSVPSPHAVPPPASSLPKMATAPPCSSSLGRQQIPAMAVEMPGSADISGLNLQFGALHSQVQNSLYAAPSSDSAPGLPNPSQMEMYEQRTSQTRRYPPSVSSSPQKDMQPKNGFHSMQSGQSGEAAAGSAASGQPLSGSLTQASVSSMATLTDGGPGPASLMTSANQMAHAALGHHEEMPQSTISQPQHNNSLSSQQSHLPQSSIRTTNASLLHPGMDGEVPLSMGGATTVSAHSGLGPVSSLAMGMNASSMGQPMANSGPGPVSLIPVSSAASSMRNSVSSGKAPPNLPPGVPPLLPNPYIMAPGLLHAYPPQVYGYDDLQMLQTRIPLDYYSIPFAAPTTALTGREGSMANNPYSGDMSNYTSLPYYTGMPGLPNTFQYGPAVFPVATSSKQHTVNVGVNPSATPFQQASAYGSHGYSTGYEDVGQVSGSGDFCKGGYTTVAAAAAAAAAASVQIKPATSVTGPGVGVSVTSSNTGVPDISGSVYTKTQSFDKQGFHTGTPTASFSLPSALGSGGPINAPAPAGYPPAPFMHILAPHQQHSQIMHHHLQQDAQAATGQRSQNASIQQKAQINKSPYNSYNWGGN